MEHHVVAAKDRAQRNGYAASESYEEGASCGTNLTTARPSKKNHNASIQDSN